MIIVTGASRGLGNAVAQRLVEKGVDVLGLARDVGQLEFDGLSCDVSSYDEVKAIVGRLKSKKTRINGLVNAAGIATMNLAVTTPPQVTQRLIQVNLVGTIYCCQLFAPLMLRRKEGSIVNFSTIAVSLGLKGESVYVASKAGVEGFSRVFAREMADFNVRVNCIAPGPINTDLISGVSKEQIHNIVERQVIRKQFHPKDVCDLTEFLLNEESSSLSGQVLSVGGS